MNTHGILMKNGRHNGELITRVPVSYLKWMINAGHGMADVAKAELERRGTTTPELEISGHAIDRASLHCRKIWHETRGEQEGLHAWLCRIAKEAWDSELTNKPHEAVAVKIAYRGMIFCFETEGVWPVLKTIMREEK